YFTPGDTGFRAWDTTFGKIGVLVCWDQWFPEGARLTALQGAEILFYPTAIGWHPSEKAEYGEAQHDSWEVIQRSHAVSKGGYDEAVWGSGVSEGSGFRVRVQESKASRKDAESAKTKNGKTEDSR